MLRRWIVALLAMLMVGAMASPALADDDDDDDDRRPAAAQMDDRYDDDDDDDDDDDRRRGSDDDDDDDEEDRDEAPAPSGDANIVATAIALNSTGPYANQFDLLIGALTFASTPVAQGGCGVDLLSALSSTSGLTVFAPTDAAFTALAGTDEAGAFNAIAGVLASVYGDACTGLIDVLSYHVSAMPGEWDDDEVEYEMLNGEEVEVEDGEVEDEADREGSIVAGPVGASNGVIWAVDMVLLPEKFDD